MKPELRFLCHLYTRLLILYPKVFREEYSEELQSVFELSLEEAATKSAFEVGRLVVREFVNLPKAVILEHLREQRNSTMSGRINSFFDFAPGSWKEFLTALLPFFLAGGIMPLLNYLGRVGGATNTLATAIMLALFGLFLVLLVFGGIRGMPRWSLPYFGFIFAILSVYPFSAIFGMPIYFLFGAFRDQSLFIDILWDGIFWYGFLTIIVVLIGMPRFSSAFQHFKNDWTQLSFILYGGVPFALWLTFDEYAGDEPYMFVSFLVLAMGAWFYLCSEGEWKRFGVLFIALMLVMSIVTVGKAILIPTQDWPFVIDASTVKAELKHTIILWGWLAVGMLLPVVARLLPGAGELVRVSTPEA